MSTVDMREMRKLESKKRLKTQSHPYYDLSIWNYEEVVHYEDTWCPITLMSRALVVETSTGKIIGRALSKFFNFNEKCNSAMIPKHNGNFRTFDKLDGSLFTLFYYNGKWIYCSRGSFNSDQSKEGEKILKEMFPQHVDLDNKLTYVFELIYPENRIVLDYGDERTVKFLTAYEIDGTEHLILDEMKEKGFNVVKEYNFVQDDGTYKELDELHKMNKENQEGFVVRYSNGDRVKVKFDDYIKLHKVRTNFSNKVIFAKWLTKTPIEEALRDIPDELNEWYRTGIKELDEKVEYILNESTKFVDESRDLDRKDFYKKVERNPLKHIINLIYNGKDNELVIETIRKGMSFKDIKTTGCTPRWKLNQTKKTGTAIYLIGPSGTGKSYYTERFMRDRRDTIRVSRDTLRHSLYVIPDSRASFDYYNHKDLKRREDVVTSLCRKIANDSFVDGKTVVFDNTNVDFEFLSTDISNLPSDVEVRFEIFDPLSKEYQMKNFGELMNEANTLKKLHERTVNRGMEVPKKNIQKQLSKMKYTLEHLDELKKSKSTNHIVQDSSLPNATIFDIDGTLARHGNRNVYDMKRVDEDTPVPHIIMLAKMLHDTGMKIILCSGREEVARNLTEKWMNENGVVYDELHFRPNKDMRKDYIVKEEMWRDLITRYNIINMFDDRDQVVNHARSLGFNVCQVAEGNF